MNQVGISNDEQALMWNGAAGRAWVESQTMLDQLFKPFEDVLADAAGTDSPARVLDIGCGTGSTTLAVARQLGPGSACTGIDISDPMIRLARRRAQALSCSAAFVVGDAQTHGFGTARFDMMISRFGVMFFNDPVRAFANLRSAASPACKLQVIAWRSPAENPFMTTAERAAVSLPAPVRAPHAPGQFAFADRQRVERILRDSAWRNVDIQPLDMVCTMPEGDLMAYLTRLGPVGRLLDNAVEPMRSQLIATVRRAFDRFVAGNEVRFNAACWMIRADA